MIVQFGVRLIAIVYLVLGVAGFLPFDFINPVHTHGIGARYLFNFVAINTIHNLIHLAIGLTGLWASGGYDYARWWARVAGIVLLALFAVGMLQALLEGFPYDQLLLGLVPLNAAGHTLHVASGTILVYLGFRPGRGFSSAGTQKPQRVN